MTAMKDIWDQITSGQQRLKGVLYYALQDMKLPEDDISKLLNTMKTKLASKDQKEMHYFHNNNPENDVKLLQTIQDYDRLLKETPQEIKDIFFIACYIRQMKFMSQITTKSTTKITKQYTFLDRYKMNAEDAEKTGYKNEENSVHHLLIITQANRLPISLKKTYTPPQDENMKMLMRIHSNDLKTLLSNAKRIRIVSSKSEMENELKRLAVNCEDKAINENDSTNILVSLGVVAKSSIRDQKTAMGILEKIDKKETIYCYLIVFLTSVKGTDNFMSLV